VLFDEMGIEIVGTDARLRGHVPGNRTNRPRRRNVIVMIVNVDAVYVLLDGLSKVVCLRYLLLCILGFFALRFVSLLIL